MLTGIIVGCVAYVLSMGVAAFLKRPAKTKAISAPKTKRSWASRQVISEYNNLPKDSQRVEGLESTLAAMDKKFGIDNVNEHFRSYEFPNIREGKVTLTLYPSDHRTYYRNATCVDARCKYKEYVEIFNDIKSVSQAHEKQKQAIKMAGLQADLDNVRAIREALRQETKIINDTTQELT